MTHEDIPSLLESVQQHASTWFASLDKRPVRATASGDELRQMLGGPLTEEGIAPQKIAELLANAGMKGAIASAGPRYFGFVVGGTSSRGGGGGLAGVGVGSEQRDICVVSAGGGDRADHRLMVARTGRIAVDDEFRVCDRRPDGELHRAGGCAASRVAQCRMGRGGERTFWSSADRRGGERGSALHDIHGASIVGSGSESSSTDSHGRPGADARG